MPTEQNKSSLTDSADDRVTFGTSPLSPPAAAHSGPLGKSNFLPSTIKPVLSIVIPNYNYGRYLKKAVDSTLSTDRQDIEVIVADNCSTDNSREVLESYSDPRLRCIFHPNNRGLFPNWNFLLEQAQGEYFKLLPSDDWLEPGFFDAFFSTLERYPESDYFLLGYLHFVGSREKPTHRTLPSESGLRFPFTINCLSQLGLLSLDYSMPTLNVIRTSLMRAGGGYHPDNHMRTDGIGIAKALATNSACVITPVNEVCAATYVHANNDRRNYVAFEGWRDEVLFLRALNSIKFQGGNQLIDDKIKRARAGVTIYLLADLRKKKGRANIVRFIDEVKTYKLITLNPFSLLRFSIYDILRPKFHAGSASILHDAVDK